jgi:hypothetical protein
MILTRMRSIDTKQVSIEVGNTSWILQLMLITDLVQSKLLSSSIRRHHRSLRRLGLHGAQSVRQSITCDRRQLVPL